MKLSENIRGQLQAKTSITFAEEEKRENGRKEIKRLTLSV